MRWLFDLWRGLPQWIDELSHMLWVLSPIVAAGGWIYTAWKFGRDRRRVRIVAVNAESGELKILAERVRAQSVTRGEVLGIARLAAGGQMLDTSLFKFDDDFGSELVIKLPPTSFALLA